MQVKIGSYVGNWKVTSDRYKKENGRLYYNDCECVCGTKRAIQNNQLNHSYTKSCGCKNPTRFHGVVVGELSLSYYNHCKQNAKRRGMLFEDDVTMDYLFNLYEKQNKLCVYSGASLLLNPRFGSQHRGVSNMQDVQTASLDRIDSKKGYIVGNVQWVHKNINMMKNNLSESNFIEWCHLVSNNTNKPIT